MEPAVLGGARLPAKAFVALDEHDALARAGENLSDGEAGDAAANDGHIIVGCRHPKSSASAAPMRWASSEVVPDVIGGQT